MSDARPPGTRPVGDHALLLELTGNAAVHAAAVLARARYGDQLEEVVPGHETLLLVWRERPGGVELSGAELSGHEARATAPGAVVRIPVRYDGADLAPVAARLGVSSDSVVEMHAGALYTVAFMGFAPGFPYLVTAPPSPLLELPRLATPRTAVPAGSVAVAAGYCGIYPRSSPGGWNLLGHSDLVLFDPAREPPSLLEPGVRVRFEPV